MASQRYTRAPITEALIELQVEQRPGITAIDIAVGMASLKDEFPERQELPADQQFQFSLGPGFPPQIAVGSLLSGFRYVGVGGRKIVLARLGAFTFSLICDPLSEENKYDRWESLRDDARRIWRVFREAAAPLRVNRIGIRYVNRFDFPTASVDEQVELSDYLNSYVQEPEQLAQHGMATYASQIMMPQPDIGGAVILTQQGPIQVPGRQGLSVILDIDVFSGPTPAPPLSIDARDDDTIWALAERVRVRKNEVFEACLTDRAREVIR